MSAERWYVTATFQNREQARQAAVQVRALNPMNYHFVATRDAEQVWEEKAEDYGAREMSI